jgi:hypothetical protein
VVLLVELGSVTSDQSPPPLLDRNTPESTPPATRRFESSGAKATRLGWT